MRPTIRAIAVSLLLATVVPAVHAQSAKSVLDRMAAEYARRMANVHDYTIVQEVMGTTNVEYMVKETVDGHPVFRQKFTMINGVSAPTSQGDEGTLEDLYAMTDKLAASADYAGTETVDGRKTHVIVLNDLSGLDFGAPRAEQDEDFTAKKGKMFVDAERWVPLRLEIEGALKTEHGTSDVTSVINLGDYREVDGVLQPFHTTMQISGLMGAMSPEMRKQMADPETQKKLAEMKKQLAEMPEAQRAMMEKMMKGQLEQLEKMTAGGGDTMTVEVAVKEVRVNAGPPKGQQ